MNQISRPLVDSTSLSLPRGAGGTGIWDGKQLYVGTNFKSWRILANGPVRTIIELHYDAWDAAGAKVSEVKRITVDAGRFFDRIDSTFTFTGPASLTAAVGLNKRPSDAGQEVKVDFAENPKDSSLVQWITQKSFGDFGVGRHGRDSEAGHKAQKGGYLKAKRRSRGMG